MFALPRGEVRLQSLPLARSLEEQPLELNKFVRGISYRDLVLGVVFLHEIKDNSVRLPGSSPSVKSKVITDSGLGQDSPDSEITRFVVNQGRNTTVRVVFNVVGSLLLALAEVEINALVGQAQFVQNKSNSPVFSPSSVNGHDFQDEHTDHPFTPVAWL